MRKVGMVSFVIYLLYTLLGGGMAIYNYIAIQKHNAEGGGLEGLGLALLLILSLIVLAVGVLGLVLKGIHLGTGWVLFGLLCMVLDFACVAAIWTELVAGADNLTNGLICIALSIPSLISFGCNSRSLAR